MVRLSLANERPGRSAIRFTLASRLNPDQWSVNVSHNTILSGDVRLISLILSLYFADETEAGQSQFVHTMPSCGRAT